MKIGEGLFCPGTDTLALADFAKIKNGSRVVDLGTGCGTFPLLLGERYPCVHITGIEIDPVAARYASENIEAARMSDRAKVICADLRGDPLPAECADAVISNPPYFAQGSGPVSSLGIARMDQCCSCAELVRAAARLLPTGGRFFLLWRPERLVELFVALHHAGLEPKRMQLARGKQVRFVMIEALRGGNPGLILEPDLDLQRR